MNSVTGVFVPALAAVHQVPTWITVVFGFLLLALILCLALEEQLHAKKSVIAGVFAVVCLFLGSCWGLLPFEEVVVGSHKFVEHETIDGVVVDHEGDKEEVHLEEAADKQTDATTSAEQPAHHEGDDRPLHLDGDRIRMPVYIPAVDWSVIAIILGSSLFVDITSKSGLFTWIAIKVTKASGGDPLQLLIFYGLMTVIFSAVLNNVTAMIIVGSLTVVSLTKLEKTDKLLGFLLIEGLLTNIGGLLTLISSVPNIIVGTAANISFVEFFYKSCPYVVVATLGTLWLGSVSMGVRRLKTEEERTHARSLVAGFDECDGIQSWGFFWFGAVMLVLFIITIATTSILPVISDLEMGFVALSFAAVMLLRYKSTADDFYRAIDWDLIGFFMALFVVINVMEHAQVLAAIGTVLEHVISWGQVRGTAAVLLASAAFSSVTDNIPLSAMLAKILTALGTPINGPNSVASPLWWAVIFGANLGGNLTPIGSASTLVAVTIMHRHKLPLTFLGFVKTALPYALVHIALATLYVLLVLRPLAE